MVSYKVNFDERVISTAGRNLFVFNVLPRKDFSLAPFGLSYIRPVFDPELRPKGAHVEGRVEDRPGSYIAPVIILMSRQGWRFSRNDKLLGLITKPSLLLGLKKLGVK